MLLEISESISTLASGTTNIILQLNYANHDHILRKEPISQVNCFDNFLQYSMKQVSTENEQKLKSYLIDMCSVATLLTYNIKLKGS